MVTQVRGAKENGLIKQPVLIHAKHWLFMFIHMNNNKIQKHGKSVDRYTIASALCGIITIPATVISVAKELAPEYISGLAALSFVAVGYFIYRVTQRNDTQYESQNSQELILSNSKDNSFLRKWNLLNHHTVLDILNDGKETNYSLFIKAKCIVNSSSIYLRVAPASKVSNLESSIGKITPSRAENYIEMRIDLDKEALIGETIEFKIDCLLTNCFPDDLEYWKSRKYYEGDSYKITVLLPVSKPARGISASIIKSDNLPQRTNAMECVSYTLSKGRSKLEICSDKLRINDELLLEWNW